MEYLAWHTGCKIDSGGWLQSSEENCGADTYPWPKFEMPELHWRRVDEQQRVSRSGYLWLGKDFQMDAL